MEAPRATPRRWLTPGFGGIGTASFLADVGHEVLTSLMASFVTSTLGASAAALGLIEGISEELAGAGRFVGGASWRRDRVRGDRRARRRGRLRPAGDPRLSVRATRDRASDRERRRKRPRRAAVYGHVPDGGLRVPGGVDADRTRDALVGGANVSGGVARRSARGERQSPMLWLEAGAPSARRDDLREYGGKAAQPAPQSRSSGVCGRGKAVRETSGPIRSSIVRCMLFVAPWSVKVRNPN
jgi:hypothetical protein